MGKEKKTAARWLAVGIGVTAAIALMASLVLAATTQKIIIDVSESLIINGKNITLLGLGKTGVSLLVDGVVVEVQEGVVDKFANGIKVTLIGFSASPPTAIFNITVDFTCGDGTCSQYEDHLICCTDCACALASESCVSNICRTNFTVVGTSECQQNEDCYDNETCTMNVCKVGKCITTPVTSCTSGDACCPKECFAEQDTDCTGINKCATAIDCDDNDACTTDQCVGNPLLCSHTRNAGCDWNLTCYAAGSTRDSKACVNDNWLDQKVDLLPCTDGFECSSGVCKEGICGGRKRNWMVYLIYVMLGATAIAVLTFLNLHLKKPPRHPPADPSNEPPSEQKPRPLHQRPVVEV